MHYPRLIRYLIVTAVLAVSTSGQSLAQPLRPEAAFPYTVTADQQSITVSFDLPEGYYLYRARFGFASSTSAVRLAPARFPTGEIHEDEFFGRQEVYRHRFDIDLPYQLSAPAQLAELAIELQGCADIGLCYPPQEWAASVALPADTPLLSAAAPAGGSSFFLPGGQNADPLPPEQAFDLNVRFDGANEMVLAWFIEPGYYLYRDQFEISVVGDINLGTPVLPAGTALTDQNYGDVQVFYNFAEIRVPFARASPDAMAVTVQATFQGCKDDSICYPPMTRIVDQLLPASNEFDSGSAAAATAAPAPMISEQDALAQLILTGSLWAVVGKFFAAGLLLAFTPCVLPMVPILSSIITAHGTVTTARSISLSLAYVLGMAITYTAAGALAAIAGGQVQAAFQQPWILTLFAGIFVVLALGMFGLFELQMPAAIQSRVAAMANRQKAGTYIGTAIMGALSALIVTACVAPPLIAALAVIGSAGDVLRGSTALFAMSIGMGVPLLVVGASGGALLPKAGPWMSLVKAGFGVMLIGVAIYMLDRILPGTVTLTLWAVLVFLTGVFLGAFDPLRENAPASKRLAKGVGVLACIYGALMLIGATIGGENPLRPLPRNLFSGTGLAATPMLDFRAIESVAELEAALLEARTAGQPVMLDFTADWCVSCKEMEEYTFQDATVVAALEPFMLLRADVTANDDNDQALLNRFRSYGPPTIAFFDSGGREQDGYRLVGYVPGDAFAVHVDRLAAL